MYSLVVFSALVACAFGSNLHKYAYHGMYNGTCEIDGLYYFDTVSYVMCTEGLYALQACAPGTVSADYESFVYGEYYGIDAFCNVNALAAKYNPVVNTYHAPLNTAHAALPSYHAPLNTAHAKLNTYHAPLPTAHAPLPTHHAKVNTYHAPVPSYHAPLPVHSAPAAPEIEEAEPVETEVEAGFSSQGLFQGYGQQDGKFVFRGKYADECNNDGLYYRDYQSYVICSNSNAYVQPCAPGTRNSAYERYASGGYYGRADFCDVNLTDFGYAAKRSAFGYSDRLKNAYAYQAKYAPEAYAYKDLSYGAGYGYGTKDLGYGTEDLGLGYGTEDLGLGYGTEGLGLGLGYY